jgi:hypothetical protein
VTHEQKVAASCALIVAGAWMLHSTFEASGRSRPFWTKFLPGG